MNKDKFLKIINLIIVLVDIRLKLKKIIFFNFLQTTYEFMHIKKSGWRK